jgi:hypothetical protein
MFCNCTLQSRGIAVDVSIIVLGFLIQGRSPGFKYRTFRKLRLAPRFSLHHPRSETVIRMN